MKAPFLLIAAALGLLCAGCSTTLDPRSPDFGPAYVPANVQGPAIWPETVRRVAVLPAHDVGGQILPDSVSAYDSGWLRALDRSQRAEFIPVPRANLAVWTGKTSFASASLLPADLLARTARETGAQAVLFLDLTHVKAYPPLALGVRARLVDATTGKTVWMADEVFSAEDITVARAARRYAQAQTVAAGDAAHAVLQSPSRFADYAFHAVTGLLPPRKPATSEAKPEKPATKKP